MSMILTMTTAAILAGMTISEASMAAIVSCCENDEVDDEGLETVFTDSSIMQKTLRELDCHMKVVSDNEIYVETSCGNLCYKRNISSEAFRLYLNEINNPQGLIDNIRSFEVDYGRNVQDYTYHHIIDNLGEGMTIESENFENDDLYITINVE